MMLWWPERAPAPKYQKAPQAQLAGLYAVCAPLRQMRSTCTPHPPFASSSAMIVPGDSRCVLTLARTYSSTVLPATSLPLEPVLQRRRWIHDPPSSSTRSWAPPFAWRLRAWLIRRAFSGALMVFSSPCLDRPLQARGQRACLRSISASSRLRGQSYFLVAAHGAESLAHLRKRRGGRRPRRKSILKGADTAGLLPATLEGPPLVSGHGRHKEVAAERQMEVDAAG